MAASSKSKRNIERKALYNFIYTYTFHTYTFYIDIHTPWELGTLLNFTRLIKVLISLVGRSWSLRAPSRRSLRLNPKSIFNPSSSTYTKHFIAETHTMVDGSPPYSEIRYYAGYFDTTTALTRIRFKSTSGNIDAGTIKMYGLKDS